MRYKIGLTQDDRAAWDAFMASSPGGNFRQTSAWGTIRQLAGWKPVYVRVEENGCIKAALLMFARRIPILGRTLLYGCRGPVLDWNNPEVLVELMRGVHEAAHLHRAILLRVDPEPNQDERALQDTLRQAGFVSLRQEFTAWNRTQYELRVALDRPEEELLKGMRRTLRQEINAARRHGVMVENGTLDGGDVERFCTLMASLEDVKNAIHHHHQYYRKVIDDILLSGGMLVKASYAGTTIATMLLAFVGDRCWAVYMANDYAYRRLNPNKLLMWEGIRIARERGCRFFDMGATQGKTFDPNDPLDAYKLGFRPDIVRFPGFFDYAFTLWLYQIFMLCEFKVIPLVYRIMRQISRMRKNFAFLQGK